MIHIRPAIASDLELLVAIDERDEGITSSKPARSASEVVEHRQRIRSMIDADGARIADADGTPIGVILWLVRLLAETDPTYVFRQLDASLFPADGRFIEIFQLWVDPAYRRRGIATALKREVEVAARARNIGLIYTHTEEINTHVLALNAKLGYREVRRGPIWDDVVRVSLVKQLR